MTEPMTNDRSRRSAIPSLNFIVIISVVSSVLCIAHASLADDAAVPTELQQWLAASQDWQRDTDGPVIELGPKGEFDDTHIFAPAVIYEDGAY